MRVLVYIRLSGDKACFHTGVHMNKAKRDGWSEEDWRWRLARYKGDEWEKNGDREDRHGGRRQGWRACTVEGS